MTVVRVSGRSRIGGTRWPLRESTIDSNQFLLSDELNTKRVYKNDREKENFVYNHNEGEDKGFRTHHDSSIVHLFGYEFARSSPDILDKLISHSYGVIGTPFVKVGTTIVKTTTGSLSGYDVNALDGSDGSYCYTPISDVLGSKSALMGCWFKPVTKDRREHLFMSGDLLSNRIEVFLDGLNNINVVISDGTETVTIQKHAPGIRDEDWHYVGVLVDRRQDEIKLIVSNGTQELAFVETVDIPENFGSLDATGGEIVVGGTNVSGTKYGGFTGSVSNFQTYTWTGGIDYNVIPMVLCDIRESCSKNVSIVNNHDGKRLNNDCVMTGEVGSYVYALINNDEGTYQPIVTQNHKSDGATYGFQVDHTEYGRFDSSTSGGEFTDNAFIENIKLGKSFNFVKILWYTTGVVSLSQVKFNKVDGPKGNGSGSLLILGDEFSRKSNGLTLASSNGNPFVSEFGHHDTVTGNDGDFGEGDFYMNEGLYIVTLRHRRRDDGGILELMVNGEAAITSDGFGNGLATETRYVRLRGDKNVIGVRINGKNADSSGYRMVFHDIRAELQAGHGYDGTVIVTGGDRDDLLLSGNESEHEHILNNVSLFGIQYRASGNVKSARKRWFSKALYKVEFHVRADSTGGTQDIIVDGKVIFNRANYNSSTGENIIYEKLVMLEAGFHNIEFDNIAATDVNVSSFLRFTPLGTIGGIDNVNRTDEGNVVKIAEYRAGKDSNVADIKMAPVTPDKYNRIIFRINGRSNGAMSVAGIINGFDGQKYKKAGALRFYNEDQSYTRTNESASHLTFVTDSLITSTHTFSSEVDMIFGKHPTDGFYIVNGKGSTTTHAGGENFNWLITGTNVNHLKEIIFTATGDTWDADTEIDIYAQKRVD